MWTLISQNRGWETWKTVTKSSKLSAGIQTLRIISSGSNDYPNLDYIDIKAGGTVQASMAPTNLTASALSFGTQVDLSWKDNSSNEDGLSIERKTKEDSAYLVVGLANPNDTTYSDKNPGRFNYYLL